VQLCLLAGTQLLLLHWEQPRFVIADCWEAANVQAAHVVRRKVDVAGKEDDIVVGVRDPLPKELGSRVACKKAAFYLETSGVALEPAGSPLHNQQYARPVVSTKQGCRRTIQAVTRRPAVLH